MPLPDLWDKICAHFLSKIQVEYPWWFNGEEGSYGGGVVHHQPICPYKGEECLYCGQPVGDEPVLEAEYHDHEEPLTFYCHVRCAQGAVSEAVSTKG